MNESHQLNVWTTALNLPEYEVVHYAQREGVRHFSVIPNMSVALCPECSKPCERQHQKRWIEDVADLPLGDQPVRLKVRVYQFACEHCGRHFTPQSLLFTPGLGAKATARLVGKAAGLIQRADITGVAAFYQIPPKTLERWYYEWVELQNQADEVDAPAKPIRSLGIDELSLKKSTANSLR
jgi:transposase